MLLIEAVGHIVQSDAILLHISQLSYAAFCIKIYEKEFKQILSNFFLYWKKTPSRFKTDFFVITSYVKKADLVKCMPL